jgi:hypothetical protein
MSIYLHESSRCLRWSSPDDRWTFQRPGLDGVPSRRERALAGLCRHE